MTLVYGIIHSVHTIWRKQTDGEKTVVYQSACLLVDEYFCLFFSFFLQPYREGNKAGFLDSFNCIGIR